MVNNSVSWGQNAGVGNVWVAEKVLTKNIYILNSKAFFIDPTPEITPAGKEKKKDRVIMRSVGRSYCDYVLVMSKVYHKRAKSTLG